MKIQLITFFIFLSNILIAQGSYSITDNGKFLSISPNESFILFSKTNNEFLKGGDYIEGNVFLFDRTLGTSFLLSKDTLVLSDLIFRWDVNNDLYFYNGSGLYYFSTHKIDAKLVLIDKNKSDKILDFSISPNRKNISIWTKTYSEEIRKYFYRLYLYNLIDKTETILYSVEDLFSSETITVYTKWDTLNNLFCLDGNGNIFKFNLLKNTNEKINSNVDNNYFNIIANKLFYTKDNQLLMTETNSKDIVNILTENNGLKVSAISVVGNSKMYIALNDNLFFIDRLNNELRQINCKYKGQFVYLSSKIFIQEVFNDTLKINKIFIFESFN